MSKHTMHVRASEGDAEKLPLLEGDYLHSSLPIRDSDRIQAILAKCRWPNAESHAEYSTWSFNRKGEHYRVTL